MKIALCLAAIVATFGVVVVATLPASAQGFGAYDMGPNEWKCSIDTRVPWNVTRCQNNAGAAGSVAPRKVPTNSRQLTGTTPRGKRR